MSPRLPPRNVRLDLAKQALLALVIAAPHALLAGLDERLALVDFRQPPPEPLLNVPADRLEFKEESVMPVWRGNDDELGVGDALRDLALLARREQAVRLNADDERWREDGQRVLQRCGALVVGGILGRDRQLRGQCGRVGVR